MRKVFSTVLNTVPKFFKENEDSAIWVQGSDIADDFKQICEVDCAKRSSFLEKNTLNKLKWDVKNKY